MFQHANITKTLVAAIVSIVVGCSSATHSASRLMQIDHCAGDVVPLCAEVRVYNDAVVEYARSGKRVLRGRLGSRAAGELRQMLSTLRISSWPTTEDPVGPFVTFNVAEDSRTLVIRHVPPDGGAVLQLVDREGQRLFGNAYRSILPPQ